jgi:hypothetical protein
MQTAKELSPEIIDAFLTNIKPLKGAPQTPENVSAGLFIINHYAGQLQLADLELSNSEAKNILRRAYMSL